jgi:hypothetical protein
MTRRHANLVHLVPAAVRERIVANRALLAQLVTERCDPLHHIRARSGQQFWPAGDAMFVWSFFESQSFAWLCSLGIRLAGHRP